MLNEQEINQFHTQGYLLSGEVGAVADQLPAQETFKRMLARPGLARDHALDRHLDDPTTYRLCTLPQILERVADLLGPDLLLWHTRYFDKPAGGPPIPWHQDAPFWPIDKKKCVSVWLALEDVQESNGAVMVVPGSHKMQLPQVRSAGTGRFHRKADITGVDVSSATPLTLRRGEFYLFHSWLLHRSDSNKSSDSRLAIAMQFIPPEVRIDLERPKRRIPGYGVLLVRGEDRLRLNPHASVPTHRARK